MKKHSLFKIIASGLLVATTTVSCVGAKTDFNEVGKQMVIMLRNSHYERYEFDEKLGAKFFDSYINALDGNKQWLFYYHLHLTVHACNFQNVMGYLLHAMGHHSRRHKP